MKEKNRINNVIPIILTLIVICQNPIWPLWNISYTLSFILLSFLFLYMIIQGRLNVSSRVPFFLIILAFLFFVLLPPLRGQDWRISSLMTILTFFMLFSVTIEEREKTIKYITTFLAYILIISLPFWLIHVFYGPILPLLRTLDLSSAKQTNIMMNNYGLYVMPQDFQYFRFYSIFDEPGVLGTLSAFILFANKYNFRNWKIVVILIGTFFTYSMAFYVLTMIGLITSSFLLKKKKYISIFILVLSLGILFFIVKEQSSFQNVVMNRASSDLSELLDNRTGYSTNNNFKDFIKSDDLLWGKGTSHLKFHHLEGNSYKLFLIEYGVIGLLLVLMMYISINKNKSYLISLWLLIFILSFLQRSSAIFTAWQLIIFVSGSSILNSKNYD